VSAAMAPVASVAPVAPVVLVGPPKVAQAVVVPFSGAAVDPFFHCRSLERYFFA